MEGIVLGRAIADVGAELKALAQESVRVAAGRHSVGVVGGCGAREVRIGPVNEERMLLVLAWPRCPLVLLAQVSRSSMLTTLAATYRRRSRRRCAAG